MLSDVNRPEIETIRDRADFKTLVAVRHVNGDHIVAMIEIVSPGNKNNISSRSPGFERHSLGHLGTIHGRDVPTTSGETAHHGRLRSGPRHEGVHRDDRRRGRVARHAALSRAGSLRHGSSGSHLPSCMGHRPGTLATRHRLREVIETASGGNEVEQPELQVAGWGETPCIVSVKGDIALCLGETKGAIAICLHLKALCPPFYVPLLLCRKSAMSPFSMSPFYYAGHKGGSRMHEEAGRRSVAGPVPCVQSGETARNQRPPWSAPCDEPGGLSSSMRPFWIADRIEMSPLDGLAAVSKS
jgi:hypothetical protein